MKKAYIRRRRKLMAGPTIFEYSSSHDFGDKEGWREELLLLISLWNTKKNPSLEILDEIVVPEGNSSDAISIQKK